MCESLACGHTPTFIHYKMRLVAYLLPLALIAEGSVSAPLRELQISLPTLISRPVAEPVAEPDADTADVVADADTAADEAADAPAAEDPVAAETPEAADAPEAAVAAAAPGVGRPPFGPRPTTTTEEVTTLSEAVTTTTEEVTTTTEEVTTTTTPEVTSTTAPEVTSTTPETTTVMLTSHTPEVTTVAVVANVTESTTPPVSTTAKPDGTIIATIATTTEAATEATEPEDYDINSEYVKDPFDEKASILKSEEPGKIQNIYFNQQINIINNVETKVKEDEKEAIEKNTVIINKAVREKDRKEDPLSVLAGIELPSMFDLTVPPPRPDFVKDLLPYKTLEHHLAFLKVRKMVKELEQRADTYQNRAATQTGIAALSDYRAAEVLHMTVTVLKRLWLHHIGVLTEKQLVWTPEYQALLHLTLDWQHWLEGQIELVV